MALHSPGLRRVARADGGRSLPAGARPLCPLDRRRRAQSGRGLPPPVTEYTMVKGRRSANRIGGARMGRPVEAKGLMSLPYLLKHAPRLVVRAWTGAETGGPPNPRRVQTESMHKLIALARDLGVDNRLDLRPLDFNP